MLVSPTPVADERASAALLTRSYVGTLPLGFRPPHLHRYGPRPVSVWTMLASDPNRLGAIRSDALSTLFYRANWHFIRSGQSYFDLFSEASPVID
jgi:hypothetical protein